MCSFTSKLLPPLVILTLLSFANAQTESIIHSFQGSTNLDGVNPLSGVVTDPSGALYGVSAGGKYAAGIIYRLVPPTSPADEWVEKTIYSFKGTFQGGSDGIGPSGNIVLTKVGRIYGTTQAGGRFGQGVVYELSRPIGPGFPWVETILYNFSGHIDGGKPSSGLIADSGGRLYGTTTLGGLHGGGVVFGLIPPPKSGGTWTEAPLYSFDPGGEIPQGPPTGLSVDRSGTLYGSAGHSSGNSGLVFRLERPSTSKGRWTETNLYVFSGSQGDAAGPTGSLALDSAGVLYGVTAEGGELNVGAIYRLTPPTGGSSWTEDVLYSFAGLGVDGTNPQAGLTLGDSGILYGTTQSGGIGTCSDLGLGCGTVFKLTPPVQGSDHWDEAIIYAFEGSSFQGSSTDGAYPNAAVLVLGGTIFGTTSRGGAGLCADTSGSWGGCGTVFQLNQ
jgi:hypothetical protein